jgi:hypothetical protein
MNSALLEPHVVPIGSGVPTSGTAIASQLRQRSTVVLGRAGDFSSQQLPTPTGIAG